VPARRSETSAVCHAPRPSSTQDTTATVIPKPATARPASRAPWRRAARATETTTMTKKTAATPSARMYMAMFGPPCPAKSATTCVPGTFTLGLGAPTSTLAIHATE
jgi:hypothetical protein